MIGQAEMNRPDKPAIGDNTVASFRDDGVVPLRDVFSTDWIELLRIAVDQVMSDPGPMSKDYARDGKGKFFTDHHMHRGNDNFRRFLEDSPAVAMTARLMESEKLNYVDEHLLVKEPGTDNPTYWHQDLPYYEVAGSQFASFWIPLDPVTAETGAMRFVRGSHLWGKVFRPIRIGLGELVDEAEALDGMAPDIDATPDDYDIVSFDMEPGDCLFFHAGILHAAYPNQSPETRRRALSLRFAGDDATWLPRPYIPSRPENAVLAEGDPLDSDQYPVMWRG